MDLNNKILLATFILNRLHVSFSIVFNKIYNSSSPSCNMPKATEQQEDDYIETSDELQDIESQT